MQTLTQPPSSEGTFWDHRYSAEGAIWGDGPSPTALLASRYLRPGTRVLEVGFGYGRDLAFLVGGPDGLAAAALARADQRFSIWSRK